LLAPIDELERNLGRLAAAGHETVIFQVIDPNELAFDFNRPMLFEEIESRRELYLDPELVRDGYHRRFADHQQRVESACRKLGIAFQRIATNQPLELALLEFLRGRSRRGRLSYRHSR
jgi:hypothetical protein